MLELAHMGIYVGLYCQKVTWVTFTLKICMKQFGKTQIVWDVSSNFHHLAHKSFVQTMTVGLPCVCPGLHYHSTMELILDNVEKFAF